MKGDFTRVTFDPLKHFSRVLMQQGRVQLDADWNEQVAILLHYMRAFIADLIGLHGGPQDLVELDRSTDVISVTDLDVLKKRLGFEIIVDSDRFDKILELTPTEKNQLKELLATSNPPVLIGKGHYYVDGILCEVDDYYPFAEQPDWQGDVDLTEGTYLVYVDVWERHLTYIQHAKMREVALDGPDTGTRSKVVWQLKTENEMPDPQNPGSYVSIDPNITCKEIEHDWRQWFEKWQPEYRGLLKAKIKDLDAPPKDPCIISPKVKYRGLENQLYRVEIHKSGRATNVAGTGETATFKWSRDNGSVIFPIQESSGITVIIEHLGRDEKKRLHVGDRVEVVDDDFALLGEALPLLPLMKVENIEIRPEGIIVTLLLPEETDVSDLPNYAKNDARHPYLRRWDSKEEDVIEAEKETDWIDLEDGIQIQYRPTPDTVDKENFYRSGDYWLIPARTMTGDVEWPRVRNDKGKNMPVAVPPHGVEHHYAPIAILSVDAEGNIPAEQMKDCRCSFRSLSPCHNRFGFPGFTVMESDPQVAEAKVAAATKRKAQSKSKQKN